jgi:hypothetical protein
MPSLLHRSALMQSRKVALTSQDFVEQGNGLVQVSLGYTAAASDASSVLPLFRVDSQPPISPSIVSLNDLQSQKLYMTNFSSSQANGLLQITASYVGASLSALRKPLIFDSVERKTYSLRVLSFYRYVIEYNVVDGVAVYTGAVDVEYVYDLYRLDTYFRTEEQQVAVIANEVIDYSSPPVISTNERAGLIMGATFAQRNVGATFDPNRNSNLPLARFRPLGDVKAPGFEFRSMNALQILQAIAGSDSPRRRAGMQIVNNNKLEHVTPSVRLISNIYEVEFDYASIYGRYGVIFR